MDVLELVTAAAAGGVVAILLPSGLSRFKHPKKPKIDDDAPGRPRRMKRAAPQPVVRIPMKHFCEVPNTTEHPSAWLEGMLWRCNDCNRLWRLATPRFNAWSEVEQ